MIVSFTPLPSVVIDGLFYTEAIAHTSLDLAVLPLNPEASIRRVMKHFSLPWDAVVTITKSGSTTLPTNTPIKVSDLLRGYVELSQPATRADIALLLAHTTDSATKAALSPLTDPDTYTTTILPKRTTIADLLAAHSPNITVPFSTFLSLLPPLSPRHYSISSSSLAHPHSCSLTYSVIDAPALSAPSTRFLGVAGSYMRSLSAGDAVLVAVRPTNPYFRPPADPERTPVVMVAAGSGLAPFRGFAQERAVLIREGGRKLAPALLFVGCRDSAMDRLYAEEVDGWARDGVVDVRYAFSGLSGQRESGDNEHAGVSGHNGSSTGCRYVQDRLLQDKEDVARMWEMGAKFYVCGSKELAVGVGKVGRRLIREGVEAQGKTVTDEEVEAFVRKMRNERFVTDVFS